MAGTIAGTAVETPSYISRTLNYIARIVSHTSPCLSYHLCARYLTDSWYQYRVCSKLASSSSHAPQQHRPYTSITVVIVIMLLQT